MRLIALTLARNESWCLAYSLRASLQWVDAALVFCHACTDDTIAIADKLRVETGRVNIIIEPDPDWREMDHRQRMLECGRQMGGTHFALIDADEVLSANLYRQVASASELLQPGFTLRTPLHNCWRALDRVRCDETPYGRNVATIVVRDHPDLRWQPRIDGYQHHGRAPANSAVGLTLPQERTMGGLLHLQHADWRRMTAKHRLYKMREALVYPQRPRPVIEKMYSAALNEIGAAFIDVPSSWWPAGIDRDLIKLGEMPWQEAECAALLAQHGLDRFAGLDLS